ncbi:MAG: DUF1697 domain-containing protein [Bacillota bacterium]|nr:DUF1697 domain-containing protein [Bacillota bacterium]
MKRYIALLRGINISGKNKVVMVELKKEFENLMFENVKTYLNSGNVIFSSREENTEEITKQIEEMLKKNYDFKIPIFVLEQERLKDILEHAPTWWGSDDKAIYDNLIFMMPPITFKEVFEEIGEAKEGLEKIQNYKDVIFWSFSRKDYQKTNWWSKTANTNVSKKLTIRTANTIRKIVKM